MTKERNGQIENRKGQIKEIEFLHSYTLSRKVGSRGSYINCLKVTQQIMAKPGIKLNSV